MHDETSVKTAAALGTVSGTYGFLFMLYVAVKAAIEHEPLTMTGSPLFTQSYGYLVDQDKILLGRGGDGNLTLYLEGEGIDEHLGEVSKDHALGYAVDHLGSVLNTDPAGMLHAYGAFGESFSPYPISPWTNRVSYNSPAVVYGFTGRQLDPESGIYYYRARPYDSGTGRFMSQDPSLFQGGDYNLYRYVWNRSAGFTDPTGLAGIGLGGSAGGSAGAPGGVGGNGSYTKVYYIGSTDQGVQPISVTTTENPSNTQFTIGGEAGLNLVLSLYTGDVEQYTGSGTEVDINLIAVSISISGGDQGGVMFSIGAGLGEGFGISVSTSNSSLSTWGGTTINSCPL